MNNLLDFTPSPEEAVISRILVMVHQAVDEHFPDAQKASRQFTKTVFSDDGEATSPLQVPPPPADAPVKRGFGNSEDTSPVGRQAQSDEPPGHVLPPPPPSTAMESTAPRGAPARQDTGAAAASTARPVTARTVTRLESAVNEAPSGAKTDWWSVVTFALLIAGLVLLAYALLAE